MLVNRIRNRSTLGAASFSRRLHPNNDLLLPYSIFSGDKSVPRSLARNLLKGMKILLKKQEKDDL